MRVLLVEDDMIIAGCLGPVVSEAGYDLVGLAADRDTANALLRSADVDLALVDLRLADGWTGMDVARVAREQSVPVVFTTANRGLVPDDFAGAAGVIEKPYLAATLKASLHYMADCLAHRPVAQSPKGFDVSPRWLARELDASNDGAPPPIAASA